MKNYIHSIQAVFVVALLFAAFAFADASPPPESYQDSHAASVQTVDRADAVKVNEYAHVVYSDHAIAIRTLAFDLKGEKLAGTAWRTWPSDNLDRNLSHYKTRTRGPDKPPNELFIAVSNNRAREKV